MQNWALSSNPKDYNLIGALKSLKKINWKQTLPARNVAVGDVIYFCLTKPITKIAAKCKVTKVNVPDNELLRDDAEFYLTDKYREQNNGSSFELELLQLYDGNLIPYSFKTPQGAKKLSDEIVAEIEAQASGNFIGQNDIESAPTQSNDEAHQEEHDAAKVYKDFTVRCAFSKEDDNYSLEELAYKLKSMCTSESASAERRASSAFHIFGIMYGRILQDNEIVSRRVIEKANELYGCDLKVSNFAEIDKGARIADVIRRGLFDISLVENGEASMENKNDDIDLPVLLPRMDNDYLNTILYGAPGTGKTYALTERAIAIIEGKSVEDVKAWAEGEAGESGSARKKLVEKWNGYVKDGRIVFTTFHQNYSYEDFIQGLRPDPDKPGEVSFKEVDGVFKKIADKALHDASNKYVMVIDEINRANISKVFGELITLIEEDKRWGEENEMSVTLPSGERFAVPNNLYIIGTMNSSDKSISLLDAALRRRFVFEEMKPDYSLLGENVEARSILTHLNEQLKKELKSSDLLIGHSYFIKVNTTKEIVSVLNRRIIPLLYEYFYDDEEKVRSVLNNVLNGTRIEIVNQDNAGRIRVRVQVEQ